MTAFSDWYDKNKEKFNEQRRQRYKQDAEYRRRQKEAAKGEKRDVSGLYTIEDLAARLPISVKQLLWLERHGMLPDPRPVEQQSGGYKRYYSERQLKVIRAALKQTNLSNGKKHLKSAYDLGRFSPLVKHNWEER